MCQKRGLIDLIFINPLSQNLKYISLPYKTCCHAAIYIQYIAG